MELTDILLVDVFNYLPVLSDGRIVIDCSNGASMGNRQREPINTVGTCI